MTLAHFGIFLYFLTVLIIVLWWLALDNKDPKQEAPGLLWVISAITVVASIALMINIFIISYAPVYDSIETESQVESIIDSTGVNNE